MLRVICVAMLLGLSPAYAGKVDDHFGTGPLGLAWGAPLEVVQAKYPGGLTFPTVESQGTFFAYEVELSARSFGLENENVHVHFRFGKDERLRRVTFLFDYDGRDEVLYRVGEVLGQNTYQAPTIQLLGIPGGRGTDSP